MYWCAWWLPEGRRSYLGMSQNAITAPVRQTGSSSICCWLVNLFDLLSFARIRNNALLNRVTICHLPCMMSEQVRNGLYIGSVDAAENLPGLKYLNITHVLQVRLFVPTSLWTYVWVKIIKTSKFFNCYQWIKNSTCNTIFCSSFPLIGEDRRTRARI